ncbi:MAG TPA: signal peptidase II [Anaerovoracaceae bacterium]|nr:signal peptidase II [Anaerovoracaceae bacterium]
MLRKGSPLYFIIIAIIVALDQFTKYLIRANMELDSSIPVADGIFNITYIHNSGAAFSMFQNKTEFLIAIQLVVIAGVLVYLIKRRKKDHWCLLLSLSFIAAGGVGNLIDRASNGYVVDFLDFHVWPVFNVADMSVCIGCGLLVIYMFFIETRKNRDNKQNGERS